MDIFIKILVVIVAILLIGVVLIQKSKGGGLSSSFAGSNQIMGVRRTNDFIEKATWALASIICVLSIASAFISDDTQATIDSKMLNAAPATATPTTEGGQYATEASATDAKATKTPATDAKAEPAAEKPAAQSAEQPAPAPAK